MRLRKKIQLTHGIVMGKKEITRRKLDGATKEEVNE